MTFNWPTRTFKCLGCGDVKKILMNHDGIDEIYEQCKNCSHSGLLPPEIYGPRLLDVNGNWHTSRKIKHIKIEVTNEVD